MNICLIEGYASGSHLYFAECLKEELKRQYSWDLSIVSTPGRHWRTRLQKGHGLLVEKLKEKLATKEIPSPELFIVTSLTDTAAFRGLLPRELSKVPIIQYMHENQMSYPLNPNNQGLETAKILQKNVIPGYHLNQLLGSDLMVFNSDFHRRDFFEHLDGFLSDHGEKELKKKVHSLKSQAKVLPIGLPFPSRELTPFSKRPKRLLWNHRWEYDKNPEFFSSQIQKLLKENGDWQLSLLGENKEGHKSLVCFDELKAQFPDHITHFGHLKNRTEYYQAISECRLLPVTSHHDFLGLAIIEAMIFGVIPLLPKRLVYPELVPQELHHKLFYESESNACTKDFHQKCRALMVQGLDNQEESLLKSHLSRFKWSALTPIWKDLISSLT